MKKILIGLMAFLYIGTASAEVDFRILDTFPWPMAARCTISDSSLVGGWELENGEFINVQEFENIDGDIMVSVEKYNTSLEKIGHGWGEYSGEATAQISMYGMHEGMFTTHSKIIFGFYSPIFNNGKTCSVKTPYLLSVDAEDESMSEGQYYQMQRFEDLALIID